MTFNHHKNIKLKADKDVMDVAHRDDQIDKNPNLRANITAKNIKRMLVGGETKLKNCCLKDMINKRSFLYYM